MKVEEFLTGELYEIAPHETPQEAARRMSALRVGVLAVTDGGSLLGILTDRDIIVRVVAAGKASQQTTVGEIMTRDVVACHAGQSLEEAGRLMEEHGIQRLVVLDRGRRPLGILSLVDPIE